MVSTFGNIDVFDVESGDFSEYNERIEQYFVANKIDEAAQKRGIFITLIGEQAYSLLRSVLAPEKPNTKSYEELSKTLCDHLKPKPLVIAERYKFNDRKQHEGEDLSGFIAAIRKMSVTCDFGDFLEEALRDRLIHGMQNDRIRKRLLIEKDLDFRKAIEISRSLECAEKEIKEMSAGAEIKEEKICQIRRSTAVHQRRKCYRCGDESHLANQCRHRGTICLHCGLKGHLAKACRKKEDVSRANNTRKFKESTNNYMSNESENNNPEIEEEIYHIHALSGKADPYLVKLEVDGKEIKFEIDTGAGITVICEKAYREQFNGKRLEPTKAKIKTYSNEI